ncbi:MAG: hypothetical protein KY469_22380 [Actinobacteria bacterium]|nr:hypothetical protein [Actinomycetota bacterium]
MGLLAVDDWPIWAIVLVAAATLTLLAVAVWPTSQSDTTFLRGTSEDSTFENIETHGVGTVFDGVLRRTSVKSVRVNPPTWAPWLAAALLVTAGLVALALLV